MILSYDGRNQGVIVFNKIMKKKLNKKLTRKTKTKIYLVK
jgi:hypothetical protein